MIKTTVLIAEDNPDCLHLLHVVLENEGFVVLAAGDGAQALLILKDVKPDVIVTDLMLPLVSGGDLIRYVRKTAELAQIPIVVVSGYSRDYEAQAFEVGASVVLQKPIDLDLLVDTVKLACASPPRHSSLSHPSTDFAPQMKQRRATPTE